MPHVAGPIVTHPVPFDEKPGAQVKPQAPPVHVAVALATVGQGSQRAPQLAGLSSRRHEETAGQRCVPDGHAPPVQALAAQVGAAPPSGAPHPRPHTPQWLGSLVTFTQRPMHATEGAAQTSVHALATQDCPVGHALPQDPQCIASVRTSTQLPPQVIMGAAQFVEHAPAAQICPAEQRMPHAPQFMLSDCVLTHRPMHSP